MSLGKRLFIGGAAADDSCKTDKADIFGDSSGIALYSLDYDASDASGNYDGTPTSAVEFGQIGQINYAAEFNGVDGTEIITTMDSSDLDLTSAWSVSCWLKFDVNANSYTSAVGMMETASPYEGFAFLQYGSKVGVSFNGGSQGLDGSLHGTFTIGQWHHCVITYSGSTSTKFYFDGTLKGTDTTNTFTNPPTSIKFRMGDKDVWAAHNGGIEQVRVFTKELSQSEVDTLYAEERCVYDSTTDNNALGGTTEAYYKLDGNALDETTNNEDGTWTGTESYVFGRYGTAANFNGSSGINLPDIGGISSLASISFWFKTTNSSGTDAIFGAGRTGNSNNYTWAPIYITSAGKLQYGYMAKNGGWLNGAARETTATYNDDIWHHVAIVYSGTYGINQTHTLYVDGVENTSTTDVGTEDDGDLITSFTGQWALGYYGAQSALYYTGQLDQVRIFSTSLDQADVDALYAERQEHITLNSTDPFGDSDLVQYLKLDNGVTAAVGTDATNNGATFSTDRLFGTHSASFDGTNDYIDTNRVFAYGDTISVWFKVDGLFGTNQTVPILGQYTATYVFYNIWLETTTSNEMKLRSYLRNTASNYVLHYSSTPEPISHNTGWHHLVWHAPSILGIPDVYLDGVKQEMYKAAHVGTPTYMPSTDALIGNIRINGTHYYLDGNLDQYRVFDRKLTGEEAYQLYAEGILDETT